jgi:tetratricopeptide (TPR) repeat protein
MMGPPLAAANRDFRSEEVAQTHGLRARVVGQVPGLAKALEPTATGALQPAEAADLLRRLQALARAESGNPFYYWAVGQVRRRAGDAAGAEADFTRAAAAARNLPLLHWLLWESYLERNQMPEADREMIFLQEIYADLGLTRFPQLADRLVREARLALAAQDYPKAARLAERAGEMDPTAALPHLLRAQILWKGGWGNALPALRSLAAGTVLAWKSGRDRLLLLGSLLAKLIVAFQLALGVVGVILFLRCHRLLSHDLSHAIRLPTGGSFALTMVVLLPAVLWLGIFWTVLLLLLFVAPYASRGERLVVTAMLLGLLVLPLGYRTQARLQLLGDSPRAVLAEEVEAGARGDEVLAQIREWAAQTPTHYLPAYYLGLVHKRRGEIAEATQALKRAVDLAPNRPAPWVALGNVLYQQGNKDGALAAYERAIAAPGNSAVAHLAAGSLFVERLQFDRSRSEFDEAFRRDPGLISLMMVAREGRKRSFLPDDRVSSSEVWGTLWPGQPGAEALAQDLWGERLRGVPLETLPMAAVAVLMAFWVLASAGRRVGQARPCPQCGKVFCGRCQMLSPEERACAACATVGNPRLGLAAPLKIQRMREAERFRELQRRVAEVLAVFLPGAGHMYLGRTFTGLLLLLPSLFFLTQLFGERFLSMTLRVPPTMAWLVGALVVVPLLVLLYAVSVLRCTRLLRVKGT